MFAPIAVHALQYVLLKLLFQANNTGENKKQACCYPASGFFFWHDTPGSAFLSVSEGFCVKTAKLSEITTGLLFGMIIIRLSYLSDNLSY